jgi:hypothetical protein
MMKVLNVRTDAHQRGSVPLQWLDMFERLDSLVKLQLIICPASEFHRNESALSPWLIPLQRMYELLGHGIYFYHNDMIETQQLHQHAQRWIAGQGSESIPIEVKSVVYDEINAWNDRLIISSSLTPTQDVVDELRAMREQAHQDINEVFKRWQTETDGNYWDWFKEECLGLRNRVLRDYGGYLHKFATGQLTSAAIYPSQSVLIVRTLHKIFKDAGIPDSELWPKTMEYFNSDAIREVSFLKINSLIWAAIARQAANGRKRAPNRGMINDIKMISVLLPYCDAIFIDNEARNLLSEVPDHEINYDTHIFSPNNMREFLAYLNRIEEEASAEHIQAVEEVYGTEWRKPYVTLYK